MPKNVKIYTDGSYFAEPDVGGWAAIIVADGTERVKTGYAHHTSAQRMELTSIIEAIREIKETCPLVVYSDCAIIVDAFQGGKVKEWTKNNWDNGTLANCDLWEALSISLRGHSCSWTKVKAHSDNAFNNRCDSLAKEAAKDGMAKILAAMTTAPSVPAKTAPVPAPVSPAPQEETEKNPAVVREEEQKIPVFDCLNKLSPWRHFSGENSPAEAWGGWIFAYLQGATNQSFASISEFIPEDEIVRLYSDAHRDADKAFAKKVLALIEERKKTTRLAEKRKRNGLSQKELSDRSGVGLRTIQGYEAGEKDINKATAKTIVALAKALCCSVEELIEPEKDNRA